VNQAKRQLVAANGTPIEWNFSTEKLLNATKELFKTNDIKGITLKYTPTQ